MGYIYKITNQINGKNYIGQTRFTVKKRWNEHIFNALHTSINYPLYSAIRKYGVDNFSISLIEEVEDEKLDEREQYWISEYNTYIGNNEGYNATLGGEGYSLHDKQQVYLLWDEGKTITEISTLLQIDRSIIRAILQTYENYSITESQQRGHALLWSKRERRKIYQYTLKGEFVKQFSSLAEIEQLTQFSKRNIWEALQHPNYQACGYQWRYENDSTPVIDISSKARQYKKPVIQYLANRTIEYASAAEASKMTGISATGIRKTCQGKQSLAGGYKWEYKGE